MSSPGSSRGAGTDRPTPFLLRLFHWKGAFHRLDEFASPSLPSSHVPVYAGMDCTLGELALELASSEPSALPNPAIGTRLAFQLVFPDLRNSAMMGYSSPHFAVKDLGSVVIGAGGPGAELDEADEAAERRESAKTLSDAKFVVGDYLSCAVLPPLSDGSVSPASAAKRDPAPSARDGRGGRRGDYPSRDGGFGRGGGRAGRQGRRDGSAERIPPGEWRRGERLPGGQRSRGRSRW